MRCPRCATDDDRVVDSRTSADGNVIRRRRECLKCFMRFTTYERIEETPLRVIKKSGERVRFERDRILAGMLRASEKLPLSITDLEESAARIEARCQGEYDREVHSSVIGSLVMEELRQLHQVAYVRFASVYREFRDVSQFLEELKPILEQSRSGAGSAGNTGAVGPDSDPPGSASEASAKGAGGKQGQAGKQGSAPRTGRSNTAPNDVGEA